MHGHAKRNGTKRHCVSYSIITSHGNPWLFHALIKTIMYILAVSNSNFLYTRHADLYSNRCNEHSINPFRLHLSDRMCDGSMTPNPSRYLVLGSDAE